MRTSSLIALLVLLLLIAGCAPPEAPAPPLSIIDAGPNDPVYATLAATRERSGFAPDEGYRVRIGPGDAPLRLEADPLGYLGVAFVEGGRRVHEIADYAAPPKIVTAYNDAARIEANPLHGLKLESTVLVYSSRIMVWQLRVQNLGDTVRTVTVTPYVRAGERPLRQVHVGGEGDELRFLSDDPPDDWMIRHDQPHVTPLHNVLLISGADPREEDAAAIFDPREDEDLVDALTSVADAPRPMTDSARAAGFERTLTLAPRLSRTLHIVRGVGEDADALGKVEGQARRLLFTSLDALLTASAIRYDRVPRPELADPALHAVYWHAWSLMEQLMMPPEYQCDHPYYLFSREPVWGWGHGGQVFHESLTMMAYAHMDPRAAMGSQRMYEARQRADGYIPYRTGPYLNETIETEGEVTTSAPWYAWTNWEVYRITGDEEFLRVMYPSSERFHDWVVQHRDRDGDGLCEWGGHAVLESVRDARVAVWDQVGWPDNFEALDLNSMLVREERSLAAMARELGRVREAERWEAMANERAKRINDTFWDEETGFYYHVDREDHDFTFENRHDLKRREIIGFLPLWAGVATPERAERLVREHLTDPGSFWRDNGVPSLAADDPYYNPRGYWNGPVWVQWQYLLVRGLKEYGYDEEARELTRRVAGNMGSVLARDHTFWEFYSPDSTWGGWHQSYIWAGIVNRMLLDTMAPEASDR